MKRITLLVFLVLTCTLSISARGIALPDDATIRKILSDRVAGHQAVGLVVGVVDANGSRVVSYGTFDGDGRTVDGDTLFEIGSTTKVFTSLLLADAASRGEVSLTDPVAKFLPSSVRVPQRGGKAITLLDLATHTSGLPRLPLNLAPKDLSNPYADYTEAMMYDFLSSYELPRDIGSKYEYSNFGAALLGNALIRRAGADYETIVRTRITEPLGMSSTVVTMPDEMKIRFAPGHDADGKRVENWDTGVFAGAGALRSSANDLLKFVAANAGISRSPLDAAMKSMLAARRETGTQNLEIALGWHVLTTPAGRELVWHNGGTGGYRSFIAFDRRSRVGVVVLSNMSTPAGVDDIGFHLIDSTMPLLAVAASGPGATPPVVKAPAEYVGAYAVSPQFVMTVTENSGRLFVQATGQPRLELEATTPGDFAVKGVPAHITFVADADGRIATLVLHQNGMEIPARRLK